MDYGEYYWAKDQTDNTGFSVGAFMVRIGLRDLANCNCNNKESSGVVLATIQASRASLQHT